MKWKSQKFNQFGFSLDFEQLYSYSSYIYFLKSALMQLNAENYNLQEFQAEFKLDCHYSNEYYKVIPCFLKSKETANMYGVEES